MVLSIVEYLIYGIRYLADMSIGNLAYMETRQMTL